MQDIFERIFGDSLDEIENKKDLSIRDKCATDLELFCKTYLSHVFTSEFCKFHKDIFKKIQDYILNKDYAGLKQYMCRAAPRGHGKSQVISMGLPIWCICYGYRFNILIVSDTSDQAAQFIGDIKSELEDNEDIIRDFGNLVGKKMWNAKEIVTANNIHVIGKGAAQKLRGIKYNSKRPDLVIIDDLENDENVETDTQRKKLFIWFMKALLKCGFTNTIFIYIGTILNYESLLYKVLHDKKFAMWDRKIYKAIYKFSDSPLWDEWEKMITNINDFLSEEEQELIAKNAYEFYKSHKEEMLAGVECLWSEKEDDYYYNLMIEKVMDEESFNSEEQNDPMTEDMRVFKEQWLIENTYTVLPEITEVYGAIDPSVAGGKDNDTCAIIMLGRGIDNFIYVLEADVKPRKAENIIEDMSYHILKYYEKLKGFVVETNVMQQFFASTAKQTFFDAGFHVPWIEVSHPPGDAKKRRIRALAYKVQSGHIKFNENHKVLWHQLKTFPKGKDDAPDALEMAMSAIMPNNVVAVSFGSIGRGRRKDNMFDINNYLRRG